MENNQQKVIVVEGIGTVGQVGTLNMEKLVKLLLQTKEITGRK